MIEGALLFPVAMYGALGVVFGSFIGTAIGRWEAGMPFAAGRSRCDACARILPPHEMIPLLSGIAAGFRCRGCGSVIAPLQVFAEAACGLIGILAGLSAPGIEALAGAAFGWQLLALAIVDARHFILPNALTAQLALSAMAASLAGAGVMPGEALAGAAAGFGSLWLVKVGYRSLRKREGIGGGDPKLFGAIGCWLGWEALPSVLLVASVLGLAVAALRALRSGRLDREQRIPLGACLATAAFGNWLVPALPGWLPATRLFTM